MEDPRKNIREIPVAQSDVLLLSTFVALTTPQPFHSLYALTSNIEQYLVESNLITRGEKVKK